MAIADKLVLPEDQADYERAGEVLWARERGEYRKEIVMQMGWGVIYFYMMEVRICFPFLSHLSFSSFFFSVLLCAFLGRQL